MRCICVVHLLTMLDASSLWMKSPGSAASMLFSDGWLAGFVILRSMGGWVRLLGLGCRV